MEPMAKKRKTSGKDKKEPAKNPWPGRLKKLQSRLNLKTNEAFAEKLGVHLETLRGWLYRGTIPSKMAQRLIEKVESPE